MGKPLGDVYSELWQELAHLHFKWAAYVELYGKKPSRVELLNRAAPGFFRIVEDVLWEDVLLHIARLTDAPISVGRKNLTIQFLPSLISDEAVKTTVADRVAIATKSAAFCRDWRNRRIAHRDLDLALKTGAKPLEPASRKLIKGVLKSLVSVINVVSGHYLESEVLFDVPHPAGGALSLLYIIDDGIRADAERKARIRRREYRDEDLKPRDL